MPKARKAPKAKGKAAGKVLRVFVPFCAIFVPWNFLHSSVIGGKSRLTVWF
jgi:hypothetical protein